MGGHAALGSLHGLLDPLECILSLGMAILVWVKLFRQFSKELGKLIGLLHFEHAGDEHLLGRVHELQNQVHLVSVHFQITLFGLLLSDKLASLLRS